MTPIPDRDTHELLQAAFKEERKVQRRQCFKRAAPNIGIQLAAAILGLAWVDIRPAIIGFLAAQAVMFCWYSEIYRWWMNDVMQHWKECIDQLVDRRPEF